MTKARGPPLLCLFVSAMEAFNLLLMKKSECSFIPSFGMGRSGLGRSKVCYRKQWSIQQVSYLLYVDDIVIFFWVSIEWLKYLRWTLMLFKAILRLKLNFEKN